MASVNSVRRRSARARLGRLTIYDLLSHQRAVRWLVVPAPSFLAGWVAADQLDRVQVAWSPGDLVGAVLTTPVLTGLLLTLPILMLTVDLPLRQVLDGEASLTFTRIGSRWIWWTSKLLSMALITFAAATACLAVVWLAGVTRSGGVSLVPTRALEMLLTPDLVSSSASRQLLVFGSPIVLTLVVLPISAVAATVGTATRRLGLAGLTAAVLAMSAPFVGWLGDVLPIAILGLLPGAAVLLPGALSGSELSALAFVVGSVGWILIMAPLGVRAIEDVR
ncbi:MAG: hypothetical protein JJT89_04250 [Nitriliruptoraceae bacterium]|nr:hypothetical protein [Nitriliruptoraceae bacterium]